MPSRTSENRVIIACAGSGKTTRLVNEALANRNRRIAFVTYTNNNIREIIKRFGELNSGVPKYVEVVTWFGFLLRECTRPYQRSKYAEKRIESLLFVNEQSAKYVKETDTKRHYFANGELIYSDKIARFVVECENSSGQRVAARLRQILAPDPWSWTSEEVIRPTPTDLCLPHPQTISRLARLSSWRHPTFLVGGKPQ